ncbi:MAG: hypothetical protein J6I72_08425 [Muribaculaceae bacterium]|nr:hypothetical protein [Muribaculaceae bacterium]
MAEEKKGILDAAKEMIGDKMGDAGNLMDKAKDFIGEKAGEMLENADELKKKAVEVGKSITPDSLDDKVEGVVDKAVDFLKDTFGKKEEKK